MVLIYWWVGAVWLAVLVGLTIIYRKGILKRLQPKRTVVKVAHSDRVTQLPEYIAHKKTYRRLLIVFFSAMCLGLAASVVLSSRPATQSLVTPAQINRDIVLCLDVSGSMKNVDVKLVETFEQLVRDFRGQRIGLDMFNYNSSQVFPLTDDYDLVNEQLALVKKMLAIDPMKTSADVATDYYNFIDGTMSPSTPGGGSDETLPSSNVGIGLAGCAQHLGENLSSRSQSIILATDNELGGVEEDAVITTKQAMMLAKQKGIRVYAIDPGVYSEINDKSDSSTADNYAGEHAVLRTYALTTGGGYYRLSSTDIVPEVISKISAQEAKLFVGDSQYAATDVPLPAFIVIFLVVGCVAFLSWRLKL